MLTYSCDSISDERFQGHLLIVGGVKNIKCYFIDKQMTNNLVWTGISLIANIIFIVLLSIDL